MSSKWRAFQERLLSARMMRTFDVQRRYVVEEMRSLPWADGSASKSFEVKSAESEIEALVNGLPGTTTTATQIAAVARAGYGRGSRDVFAYLEMGSYGVSFTLANAGAKRYLAQLKDLELSERNGSISATTKKKIRSVLRDMVNNGTTYDDAASRIMAMGREGTFSRDRAKLIATNQVGHAYCEGNREMVTQFERETGLSMEKDWQTVNDSAVTPECRHYQGMGWIPKSQAFTAPSERHGTVSDMRAPRYTNPRCRCVVRYRVSDGT